MLSLRLVLPSIAAVVLLTVGTRLNAAVTYHFSSSTEGTYPGHSEGTVVMEGKRWRIDYERDPNEVTVFNAIIGTEAADMIAINDSNQTWYRFKSPAPLEIQSPLSRFSRSDHHQRSPESWWLGSLQERPRAAARLTGLMHE